jgi:hypothetical protein
VAAQREPVEKPDPTLLTTASLLREISNLKELTASNLETVRISLQTAIDDLTKRLDHKYVETAAELTHLRELLLERIEGMRELSKQAREDNKISLDAAFKSAKDAQDKTEQSFTKQIESLAQRSEAANKATNEKIDRMTSRLDLGEGKSRGAGDLWGFLVGAAGVAVALAAVWHVR